MAEDALQQPKLHWKWVIISVLAGLVIVGASYYLVAPIFHSREVLALVMLVGFIVTGVIIGYYSPGVTINEATLGGSLVMLIILWSLYLFKAEVHFPFLINLLLLILGVGFSWVGGWAGEKLQGDEKSTSEAGSKKFLWKWVIVGVIVGFALNVLIVFLLSALFLAYLLKFAFVGFILSFVVMGFVIGYKSPGVTLKEPAVAGLMAVILDWVFLDFIIDLRVTTMYLVMGLIMGFLISLFGAWLGERYQQSAVKKEEVAA
jgi:hypothetical protein